MSFKAIRAEMETNLEGAKYLDFSDEKLEWQNLELFIMGVACLNGHIPLDRANSGILGYNIYSKVWVPTVGKEFGCQQSNSSLEVKGIENSSRLVSTWTELFCLTNFRAKWQKLEKKEIHHN